MTNNSDPITILIIDDEKDIRDGVDRILTRMNCKVLKAPKGEDGLKILEKENVAIVLLDMKMPGMDGMEVLKRIRERDASILVIVITGFATVETAIEAMKRGAYDFIPKPFEPDQLRIVINRAVERIRLSHEAELLEKERQQTLFDLDTEKSRIRTIIESLPNGVVVTNSQGQVVLINPACRKLLGLKDNLLTGQHINKYIPEEGLCDLVMEISQGKHVDFDDIPTYEFDVSGNTYLLARGQPVLGERRECMGAVVNIVDITAMKALDQLKSEFVAKVSHELRSPLSTIHEQLAVVLQDMVEEDTHGDQEILSRAKEKTMGMISLIGDLLDLSRIEAGITSQEPTSVDIGDVLKNITDFLNAKAKGKDQTLTLELPQKPLPAITADPVAIESVFGNLITNAIHYTQTGGAINVKADLTGINLRVVVSDNGFGINEKYLDKIFERFYRVKDDKTRFITGTGLGLPIVKSIVDSLGGMIDVDSTPGEGSTFTVLLPFQDHVPAA